MFLQFEIPITCGAIVKTDTHRKTNDERIRLAFNARTALSMSLHVFAGWYSVMCPSFVFWVHHFDSHYALRYRWSGVCHKWIIKFTEAAV